MEIEVGRGGAEGGEERGGAGGGEGVGIELYRYSQVRISSG